MRGTWQGRTVWWAVQEFGRPMPDCPHPDDLLRKKIDVFDEELTQLKGTISNAKNELDTVRMTQEAYILKVNDYNLLVDLFNSILGQEKAMVQKYNTQVSAYNSCIGQ